MRKSMGPQQLESSFDSGKWSMEPTQRPKKAVNPSAAQQVASKVFQHPAPWREASWVAPHEAAQVLLTRVTKWSWLKAWAVAVAKRRGQRRAIVALARRLAVIMLRMWRDGTEFRWARCAGETG